MNFEIATFDLLSYFNQKLLVAKCRTNAKPKEIKVDKYYLYDLYSMQDGKCAITGREMTFKKPGSKKKRVATNCSVDRIDSSKGYVKGNIHLVCGAENISKNRYPFKYYLTLRKNRKEHYDRVYA